MTPHEEAWAAIQRLQMRMLENERLRVHRAGLANLTPEQDDALNAQVAEAKRQLRKERNALRDILDADNS